MRCLWTDKTGDCTMPAEFWITQVIDGRPAGTASISQEAGYCWTHAGMVALGVSSLSNATVRKTRAGDEQPADPWKWTPCEDPA